MSDRDLRAILDVAQKQNPGFGLTGALCFHKENFLQYLEGPEPALRQLMANIEQDPRHQLLSNYPGDSIEQRVFADWSMAFCPLQDRTGEAPSAERDLVTFLDDLPPLGDQTATNLFFRSCLDAMFKLDFQKSA